MDNFEEIITCLGQDPYVLVKIAWGINERRACKMIEYFVCEDFQHHYRKYREECAKKLSIIIGLFITYFLS